MQMLHTLITSGVHTSELNAGWVWASCIRRSEFSAELQTFPQRAVPSSVCQRGPPPPPPPPHLHELRLPAPPTLTASHSGRCWDVTGQEEAPGVRSWAVSLDFSVPHLSPHYEDRGAPPQKNQHPHHRTTSAVRLYGGARPWVKKKDFFLRPAFDLSLSKVARNNSPCVCVSLLFLFVSLSPLV